MDLSTSVAFVTGANGFVGSRVVRRLVRRGARVRALVRRLGECEDLRHGRVQEVLGEFIDPTAAATVARGTDLVVHCAATVGKDLDDARQINVEGTRSVVNAALEAKVERFVHISTMAVYEVKSPDIDESSPTVTLGHQYSVSKAEAEEVVRAAMAVGLPATILRPPCILGAHPTSAWAVKAPEQVRSRHLKLLIDGENTFAWVHVENLIDAIELVVGDDRAIGQTYNVIDGHTTWRQYTDEVRRWFDTPELDVIPAEEVSEGAYWKAHFSKAKIADLGYRTRRTFEDGMREAEAYWQAREREASVADS